MEYYSHITVQPTPHRALAAALAGLPAFVDEREEGYWRRMLTLDRRELAQSRARCLTGHHPLRRQNLSLRYTVAVVEMPKAGI
jgi:hypothetical protein